MTDTPPTDFSVESTSFAQFEQIRSIVESEFATEEGFVDHDIPTFYVQLRKDSKEAFLRLLEQLKPIGFIATLRKGGDKTILRVINKPPTKPSRHLANWVLLLVTLGTVLYAGYVQSLGLSNPLEGALMFTCAIMGILGSHEMGHKLLAGKHDVEATYPYFIPGVPPIGTFGAVIQQKSLPPNKDALFDVGVGGPIVGFLVTLAVTAIGIPLSIYSWEPVGSPTLSAPLMFRLIGRVLSPAGTIPPSPGPDYMLVVLLHPVAFAGWVGMVITMLNLLPAGMLDGGHTVRSILGPKVHRILGFLTVVALFVLNYWLMAIFVLFMLGYQHPGPLDGVSELTNRRKLVSILLILVFVLCVVPLWPM